MTPPIASLAARPWRWILPTSAFAALCLAAPGARADTSTRLPSTGLTIELPDGWATNSAPIDIGDGDSIDVLQRRSPQHPSLELSIGAMKGNTCDEWATRQRDKGARLVTRPGFLPTGWHRVVTISPNADLGPGSILSTLCLDTLTGVIFTVIAYEGSETAPGLGDASPLLVQIAESAGVDSALPGAGDKPKPLPPPSSGGSPSSGSSATSSTSSSGGGSSSSSSRDDDDSPSDPPDLDLPRAQVSALYLMPDTKPEAVVITAGVDGATILADEDEHFGFAVGYGASLGVSTKINIPFDARGGAGLGLRFGRFALIPLVGLGTNTMGSGADGSYKVPLAFYWYAEARARLTLGSFALEAMGAHQARGSMLGDADDVPNENRVSLLIHKQLSDYSLSIGGQWLGFDDANGFGGVIGLSL